jgi:DNA integrity scanning protein DisA with diadenylate cyclase activity
MQLFIFSLTPSGIKIWLSSEFFAKRLMLLWRMALMFLLSFIASVLFSVLFRWFPLGDIQAWLSFIISLSVCFALGIFFVVLKTRLEDKNYNKLLSDYKAKQIKERVDK